MRRTTLFQTQYLNKGRNIENNINFNTNTNTNTDTEAVNYYPRELGQTHVHEYLDSTKLAEEGEDRHNHRFAGVTSGAIPRGNNHVHRLLGNTDFFEDHHHEAAATTGPAIPVGNGRHVHFVSGSTTRVEGHVHQFNFATLIENPIGE